MDAVASGVLRPSGGYMSQLDACLPWCACAVMCVCVMVCVYVCVKRDCHSHQHEACA